MIDRRVPPRISAPRHRRLSLWGPVAAYCLLIFALSSVSAVPALPGGMSDKIAHLLLYSGLGFLVARALAGVRGLPALPLLFLTVLCCAVYGLSDETHQLFVPTRQFEWLDLAADASGGASGGVAWVVWDIIGRFSGTWRRPGRGGTEGE